MEQQQDPPYNAGNTSTRPTDNTDIIGDAPSLGLAAFAATTFVFGLSYTTIWSPQSSAAMAISLALVYGGAIQILAGIWAFVRRQTFPAVTLCSFGAFYVAYYEFSRSISPGLSGADVSTALEIFLLAWLIFSSYVFIATLHVNHVAAVAYFFWWLTYLLLVIGLFLGNSNVIIGGGAAGVATAAAAWYWSCALLINDTAGKHVLPLFLDRRHQD